MQTPAHAQHAEAIGELIETPAQSVPKGNQRLRNPCQKATRGRKAGHELAAVNAHRFHFPAGTAGIPWPLIAIVAMLARTFESKLSTPAEFKGKFFRTKDSTGNQIDYVAAVSGHLQLVPDAAALKMLEADYKKMADDGILLDDAEPFAALIARCSDLEKRANAGK
jgi:hypothetical protein